MATSGAAKRVPRGTSIASHPARVTLHDLLAARVCHTRFEAVALQAAMLDGARA